MRRNFIAVSSITTALLVAACSAAPSDDASSSTEAMTRISSPCGSLWCPLPVPKPKTRGDVNGDLRADIALTSDAGWTTIPVALSQGDSYFQFLNAPITGDVHFGSYASQKPHVLGGDFDGDGRADVALAGPSTNTWTTIPVAFSRGSSYDAVNSGGGDNARITQYASLGGTQMVTTDINGDGKDDLVAVNKSGFLIGLSNGDGTFRAIVPGMASGSPNTPDVFSGTWSLVPGAKLVAGDFNGDGSGDVALTGGVGWASIPVAFGRRDGSLSVANVIGGDDATFAGYAGVHGAAPVTGDFNGDGKTDIALAGGAGWNTVPVAFSNGDGSFRVTNRKIYYFGDWATQQTVTSEGIRGPWFVAGDFNGDGKADIALTGAQNGSMLPVAFSTGDGSFGALTIPFNRPLATFPDLAALGSATAVSASSAPVQTGCDAVSDVRVERGPGSTLAVTITTTKPVQLRVGAMKWSFATYPDPDSVVQLMADRPGVNVVTVPHVKNGEEYWLQVGPTPFPSSNGVMSCGPAVIDVPANACGTGDLPCCSDVDCNGSGLVCVPATASAPNPTCVACGAEGEPPCDGGACNAGYTIQGSTCTRCGIADHVACNGFCDQGFAIDPRSGKCEPCGDVGEIVCGGANECTGAYTWPQGGFCTYDCGLDGEGCCDRSLFGGWCRNGLQCHGTAFDWNSKTCGAPNSGDSGCTATKPVVTVKLDPGECTSSGVPMGIEISNGNCGTETVDATVSLIDGSNNTVWHQTFAGIKIAAVGATENLPFTPQAPNGNYILRIRLSDGTGHDWPLSLDCQGDNAVRVNAARSATLSQR